ncbi:MAG: hypothetical protein MN733_28600 [Nitrososphaera sp.]|nr:hypothetical protein [Nitrososphaera sp.]
MKSYRSSLARYSIRRIVLIIIVPIGIAVHIIAEVVVRRVTDPFNWTYAILILCLFTTVARIMAVLAPAQRDIPAGLHTIGKEGWKALFYVLAVLAVTLVPTIPVSITLHYIQMHPESAVRTLPLASVGAGIIFACGIGWFLRERLRDRPLEIIGLFGSSVTVFGALGAGIAYLQNS